MLRYFWFFILAFLLVGSSSAQVASDFYFPMLVGNSWAYHTDGLPGGWASRATRETIDGTDVIGGRQYHRVKGVEILDSNTSDTLTFHVFWLRPDSAGNIVMGAVSDNSTNIAVAAVFDAPLPFFPNEFLTAGYSRVYVDADRHVSTLDSVESTTEAVTVGAGVFVNCLKIRSEDKDTLGRTLLLEIAYYAPGVGEVKRVREVPVNEVHTNDLLGYSTVTAVDNRKSLALPGESALWQNYPNPFNPTTTIRYSLPQRSYMTLTVFNTLGQQVAELVNGEINAGDHEVHFNAGDLASGVYFYRLAADNRVQTRKLILMR